ncbi:MAG: hypothetical protein NT154_32620 [Verrucomicrobia bacterium]|nr:hypothetical protein [Verrucomicrobiota bacterium]
MTHVVSLRIPPEKVAAIDRRDTDSGLDRTWFLLRLVDQDLARPTGRSKRRFASLDLLGRFRSRGSLNSQVRAALRAQGEPALSPR